MSNKIDHKHIHVYVYKGSLYINSIQSLVFRMTKAQSVVPTTALFYYLCTYTWPHFTELATLSYQELSCQVTIQHISSTIRLVMMFTCTVLHTLHML